MKSTVFGVILVRISPHSNRIRTRITAWYWIYFQKLCLYCLIEYYFRKTVVTFLTCSQSNSYYIIQHLVYFIKKHSSNPDVHSVVIPWKWLNCKSVFNPAQVLVSSSYMDPLIFSFSSEQFPLILSKEQFFVAGEHRPSVYHS